MEEPKNKKNNKINKKDKLSSSKYKKRTTPSSTATLNDSITKPSPTPNAAELNLTFLSREESDMFTKHINEYLTKKNIKRREEPIEFRILKDTTSEFLESYITIGYSYEGQRILIQHYPTAKDKDAILEYLKNVFVTLASKDGLIIEKDDDDLPI